MKGKGAFSLCSACPVSLRTLGSALRSRSFKSRCDWIGLYLADLIETGLYPEVHWLAQSAWTTCQVAGQKGTLSRKKKKEWGEWAWGKAYKDCLLASTSMCTHVHIYTHLPLHNTQSKQTNKQISLEREYPQNLGTVEKKSRRVSYSKLTIAMGLGQFYL